MVDGRGEGKVAGARERAKLWKARGVRREQGKVTVATERGRRNLRSGFEAVARGRRGGVREKTASGNRRFSAWGAGGSVCWECLLGVSAPRSPGLCVCVCAERQGKKAHRLGLNSDFGSKKV